MKDRFLISPIDSDHVYPFLSKILNIERISDNWTLRITIEDLENKLSTIYVAPSEQHYAHLNAFPPKIQNTWACVYYQGIKMRTIIHRVYMGKPMNVDPYKLLERYFKDWLRARFKDIL